jgi:glutamate-1-semialdehyde 2,1-aminomutase
MVFKRFLGRRSAEPEVEPPEVDAAEVDDDDSTPPGEIDDTIDSADIDAEWRARAADVIPGGASTGSKRAAALYGPETAFGPTHYARSAGCRIFTPGGQSFIDCTMALGAVALGYADELVTTAVANAAAAGNVAGLSPTSEVEVAEKLCEVIPCAEQVRFLKTGAEAVAAAVRIARTSTGRSRVIGSGYFGWLDWWTDAAGVPAGAHADYTPVAFDDIAALDAAADAAGGSLAAIVLEPVVERLPSAAWIARARAICDRTGAVLIFDEVKTGFRLRTGGYQEYASVQPDLAAFGKAMANGSPIAAVVGRAAVMEAAADTWISSTLASETTSLAAIRAVLEWHERADVCDFLWTAGEEIQSAVRRAVEASGVGGVSVEGIAPMWFLRFDEPARESRFLELALSRGVLFKRGPYNFASLAHDDETIARIEHAASDALVELAEEEQG